MKCEEMAKASNEKRMDFDGKIGKQVAVSALMKVYYMLMDIDAPAEIVPEYMEYKEFHSRMQEAMKFVQAKMDEIEAIPERTGYWIYDDDYHDTWVNHCNECGEKVRTTIDKYFDFCPNCGLKNGRRHIMTKLEEYVEKYCQKEGVTPEEAMTHAVVKEVAKSYGEEVGDKKNED